jgi:conjugative relaxase-like TrwC/TraI family protein
VLSIAKLYAGHQEYYKDAVARGLDEYYSGAGELPGRWIGRGAELLGLSGELDGEGLDGILEGRDPRNGTRLTESTPKVIGYDATFCAPKSVSLLYALGTPDISRQVKDAHDAAIADALRVLEDLTCRVRRGHAGATVVEADGYVGAAFQHRSSRAGDPHLHTHVVIAHAGYLAADGRWTALDGRQLFPWSKPVGHVYEAKLRLELTRRLGIEWGPVRKGIADIAAVPREVITAFSQRRAEIEAHLEERGQSSARSAQLATYATRRPKNTDTDMLDLFADWRDRAKELGVTPGVVSGWTGSARLAAGNEAVDHGWVEALFERLAGPDGLTERRSSFDHKSVIREVADAFGEGAEVDVVVDLADEFLSSQRVVALPVSARTGHVIRRRDGTTVPLEWDLARYSTPELLALERRVLRDAKRRQHEGVARLSTSDLRWHLSGRTNLSAEQKGLVAAITTSGRGVDIVVGAAGTGKTASLAAARHAWEATRHSVIGCALAARAAAELRKGAGIEASTIDRLLAAARDDGGRVHADVLVVDEAGMVGTRQLTRLLDLAAANKTKVVLVGDHRQLPEINAGGAFAALAADLGAVTLRQNRRQTAAWERSALSELRDGNPDAAVDLYLTAGRLAVTDDAPMAHQGMVQDWWAARSRGEDALMLAGRRGPVETLNRLARSRLRDEGWLGPDAVVAGGRAFGVGDAVIAGKNDYRIGLLNGSRGTVTAIDTIRKRVTVETSEGRSVDVPTRYLAAGYLAHGYATTIHKAQGATVDTALLLIDDQSYREAAYTGLSRGRVANRVYVITNDSHAIEAHGLQRETPDELATLRQVVRRSAAHQLASRTLGLSR